MTSDAPPEGSGAGRAGALGVLLEVQDLATLISQLQHRKASLPERRRLAALGGELEDLEARAVEARHARDELAARQGDIERQVATARSRRRSLEQRMYAARGTPSRELQAMDEEIRRLSERETELEEVELEAMVEQEPIDAVLEGLAIERDGLERAADELRGAIAGADSTLDAELAAHQATREVAAAQLPVELLRRYETLRAKKGGVGAARLVGNRCSGCHLELPSMEVERIRHLPPGTVVACDQCGRILVPVPPDPAAKVT